MKIMPVGDRILIRVVKIQEQIVNRSIVVPESVTIGGSIGIGEIIGLGEGYLTEKKTDDGAQIFDPLESKIGDRIIFNARAGLGLSRKYRLIRESEIVARVKNTGVDLGDEFLDGGDVG